MNSKRDSDDENEEEDEFGVAERLKLIREGKYKTEYLSDSSDSEIESFEEKGKKRKSSQKGEGSTKFMRPEWWLIKIKMWKLIKKSVHLLSAM